MTNRRRAGRGTSVLEADHHRFWFELHGPEFLDALLDLIFQGKHFSGCGLAAIHNCQGMFGGNADVAETESAGEAGFLDQPSR